MVRYSLVFSGRKRQCEEIQRKLDTFLRQKMPQHKPKSYVTENYEGLCIVEVAKSYRRHATAFMRQTVGGVI